MLNDSITPKQYKLLNEITQDVPALLGASAREGLVRLQGIVEQSDYIALGTYVRYGSAISVRSLDGETSPCRRDHVAEMVSSSDTGDECIGWYAIHPGSSDSYERYCHYFINL